MSRVLHAALKNKKEENDMRLLILAATATLALTSVASASDSAKHAKHHYRESNASVAADPTAAPADTMSAHDSHMQNPRESGYNPAGDRDAAGNMRTN